ncbi:MAG: hypothetical protein IJP34_05975 [Clostridia bacterium]|nr:hypothetical protein [Clostridia bacterium]
MRKTKKLLSVLIAVVLAFSCFAAIPMTASAATTVTTADQLTAALADTSVEHIIIGASISTSTTFTVNRAVTLEGATNVSGYHLDGGKLDISGNATILIKNVKITRGSDTVKVSGSPTVTISGGEIYCSNSGTGNEGGLYVTDFNGTLTVTDDAIIKGKNWAYYTGTSKTQTGTVYFRDAQICKETGGRADLMNLRGSLTTEFGGGTADQQVNVTGHGMLISTADGSASNKIKITIKDGAVFTEQTGAYGIYVNNAVNLLIYGGEFNFAGAALVINDGGSYTRISGGVFNCSNERIIQKNNGALTVTGGTFNNTAGGAVIKTASGKPNGALWVEGGTYSTTGTPFVFEAACQTTFQNVDITCNTDAPMVKVGSGVTVRLDNANLTSNDLVIEPAADSVIEMVNPSTLTSVNGIAVPAGTTLPEGITVNNGGEAVKLAEVNGVKYDVLADALAAVEEGGTLNIIAELGDTTLDADKTYTVKTIGDGVVNGRITVTAGNVTFDAVTAYAIAASNAANVVIDGCTLISDNYTSIRLNDNATGTITVKNGTVVSTGDLAFKMNANSTGTINFEDCTLTNTSGDFARIDGNGTINVGKEDGSATVVFNSSGDTFWTSADGGGNGSATINVYDGVEVNGGLPFNLNSNNVTVNIYGGTFTPGSDKNFMKLRRTATVNIYDAVVNQNVDYSAIFVDGGTHNINIEGGEFYGVVVDVDSDVAGGTLNVTGGTYLDSSDQVFFKLGSTAMAYKFTGVTLVREENLAPLFEMADGTYAEFDTCELNAGGGFAGSMVFQGTSAAMVKLIETELVDDSFEEVTIIYDAVVCSINGVEYHTFEDAMEAVQDGDTVLLIDEAVGAINFNADKTYTVDCNGYHLAGTTTVSAGNVTFVNVEATAGIVADGAANIVIEGGYIEAGTALTLASTFTGTLTVKDDAAITGSSYAIQEYAGNTGTLNLENCTLTDTSGDFAKLEGAGTINLGTADGEGKAIINGAGNVDVFWFTSTGGTTFNVYAGAEINGGTPFNINGSGVPTINVYGGKLVSTAHRQIFNVQKTANINISGGTFSNNSSASGDAAYMGEVVWVRANAANTVVNVTGGTFAGASARGNDTSILGTVSDVENVTFNVSNVTFNMGASAAVIKHQAASGNVTLTNVKVNHSGTGAAIDITGGNGKVVTINGCNFTAYEAVVNFAVEGENTMTVNFEGEKTTLTSSLGEVIVKTDGVTINGLENAEEVIKYDGITPRMLRIAGKTRDDYPNVNRDMRIEGNTTYTYSFNYRATGGAVPYITVQYKNTEGDWVDIEAATDTGAYAEYTFTLGEVPADTSTFRIRLGSKAPAAIASSGTVYFANLTLKAADSDENLIENGNFASGPKAWNIGNNNPAACYDFEFIPYVAELFDDEALTNNNAALLLKGGARHEAQFFVALDAGASYTFKFDYRSNTSFFTVGAYNGAVIEEVSTEGFTKTYTISNPTEAAIKARVYFRLGADSYDANLYLSNLVLFNNADANQTNIIADLNPIFGTADNIRMSQNGENAVKNIIGHGWLGNFQSDSDGGNVNVGSSKYTSIVEIPEDFFTVYEDAQILVNLKQILVGLAQKSINPYEDANNDGDVSLKDLIRVQKRALGLLGSDAAEAELKAVIDAGVETATNGAAYYVETVEDLKNAVSKSGTKTIFLKRGNTYRSTSEIALNSNTTLSAYGEGAKPEIIGSAKDYATSTWTDNGNNIWSVSLGSSSEVGNIYLFKGNEVISGVGFTGTRTAGTTRFTSDAELANQGDYYQSGSTLRIYSVGNPATVYDRIEIAQSNTLLGLANNVTVENIAVKYSGGHGMQGSNNLQNVTVRYCEVAYVGGRTNNGQGDPLGNGIEFGNGGSNLEASYNYVYQCYDSAITPQAYDAGKNFENVRITNNLLTNNFYGLEIWGTSNSLLKDILVEGNIIANTGYCWSFEQRPLDGNIAMFSAHIYGGRNTYNANANNSIIIRNNTFSNARVNIICWFWGGVEGVEVAKYPYLTTEGNIYYQDNVNWDGYIMRYGDVDSFDYATSQESLADAVSAFDENALLVAWLG